MDEISVKAYGKVNLCLDVLGVLPNGYHEVSMIMQTVDLYDVVTVKKASEPGIRVTCDKGDVPEGPENLAYRAADALLWEAGIEPALDIHIQKNIPVAAGMAGGSTDCAAVLDAVNILFDLKRSKKALQRIGVKLGADVPYCLMGGTALSEGIGEILSPLPEPPKCVVLLAKPDLHISTKYVYDHLDLSVVTHPPVKAMVEDLEKGDLQGLCSHMGNVLESVTGPEHPEVGRIEEIMKTEGALQAVMSGSGPTVFGIFDTKEKAEKAKENILNAGLSKEVFVSSFTTPERS